MSSVLNKVPQLSHGTAPGIDELAAEPPAANGHAAPPADAGQATVASQQPEAPATPSSETIFAVPASSRDAAEATPAQQAGMPAEASAEPAAEAAQGSANQPDDTAAVAAAPQAERGAAVADTQVPEAQAAADAPDGTDASGAGFSTPVKAQQPAATGSQETPAVVRSMTGVAEGFHDPTASAAKTKQSVGDVVAASLAEAAPMPADEQEYDTFHEAVDEELQNAKVCCRGVREMMSINGSFEPYRLPFVASGYEEAESAQELTICHLPCRKQTPPRRQRSRQVQPTTSLQSCQARTRARQTPLRWLLPAAEAQRAPTGRASLLSTRTASLLSQRQHQRQHQHQRQMCQQQKAPPHPRLHLTAR